MNNNTNESIMDKLTKICVCKAISRKTIKDAIKNGACTTDKVMKVTGAGTGSCKGCRCINKIDEILNQN